METLLKEAIATLKHAEVFISSRQKMHEEGRELYQETIDKLKIELKRRQDIEDIKRKIEEEMEKKLIEAYNSDEEKCSDGNTDTLEAAIAKLKDAPK